MAITIYEKVNDSYKIVNPNEDLIKNISKKDKIVQIDTPNIILNNVYFPLVSNSEAKKPKGIWYAYGISWLEFVGIVSKPELHLFKINVDMDKILIITKDNIYDVCKSYGVLEDNRTGFINWNLVSKNYYGVDMEDFVLVQATYRKIFKTSFIPRWLETWDVPSGCVWNIAAIKSLVKI